MERQTYLKSVVFLLFTIPLMNTALSMFLSFMLGAIYSYYIIKNREARDRFTEGVKSLRGDKITLTFIFICFWSLISFIWGRDLLGLVIGFIYMSLLMFYLSLKFELNSEDDQRLIMSTFLITVFIVCGYLMVQILIYKFIYNVPFKRTDAFSTMDNANIMAVYALLGLFIALNKIHKGKPYWVNSFYILVSLMALTSIFLASSRAIFLAVLMGFLLISYKYKPKYLIAVFGFVTAALTVPAFQNRMLEIFSYEQNVLRIKLWRTALHMTIEHPILGSGLNNFYASYQKFIANNPQLFNIYDTREIYHAHNFILRFSSELGLVGLIAILLFIFFSFKSIRRMIKLNENNIPGFNYGNLNSTYVVLFTFYFANAFDSYFSIAKILTVWVMISGLYAGFIYRNGKKEMLDEDFERYKNKKENSGTKSIN